MKKLLIILLVLISYQAIAQNQKVNIFSPTGQFIGYAFIQTQQRPPAGYPGDSYIRNLISGKNPISYNKETGEISFAQGLTTDWLVNTGQNHKIHFYSHDPNEETPRMNFYLSRNLIDMDWGDVTRFKQPTFGSINGDASSTASNLYIGVEYFKFSPFNLKHAGFKMHSSADASHVKISSSNSQFILIDLVGVKVQGLLQEFESNEAAAAVLPVNYLYKSNGFLKVVQ